MKNFNVTNLCNQVIRRGSGARLNLFRYAAMVLVLLTLGMGNAWAGSSSTQGGAYLKDGSPTGSGKVYVVANDATVPADNKYVNCTTDGYTADGTSGKSKKSTFYFYAKANSGYKFTGWYSKNSDDTYTFVTANASWSGSVTSPSSEPSVGTSYTYLNRYAEFIKVVSYSFVVPEHGSFTVTNNGTSMPAYETFEAEGIVHAVATPVEGYRFGGWYTTTDGGTTRNYFSYTAETDLSFSDDATVGADFRLDNGKALFHVINGGLYENLNTATTEASTVSPKVVVVAQDGLLSAGSYNIPSGVTLLVPYNSANLVQTEPTIINKDLALKAYKKLTFADGANISVSGVICVGGQIMSASGGNPSGYTTGACGVIDMSQGGHIELKSGATLYAWGFITGQDLNQGNNTVGAGTITAKNGSKVWENLAFGDWRGGTACSSIANTRFFPFQSYFVQNIEVQLSVEFGAEEKCYSVVNASSSDYDVSATLIGQSSSLFKLTDANSVVCKWYDATTDLMCYELQGTANFDAIVVSGLPVIQSISSEDFDLPISSNMHIILSNSNVTLNKDMVMQPGSKIEIKSGSSITVSAKVYLYDKDDWGAYAGPDYYFHNYGNANGIFTSHKNRGNGTSKNGLDDAQFIVDGTLTVTGKLYTTTHGADIMGNGGGKVIFSASLPDATTIPAFTSNGNAVSGGVAVTAANLCNEDGTYTKSIGSSTFHNNWGRWFIAADKDERANHTYAFKYMANGNSGDDVPTDAVYAPDKTGLVAGMKWCNVSQDATCTSVYNATQSLNGVAASDIKYTYPSDTWLQLRATETANVFGGSDNNLYAQDGCTISSLGSVDENCLYTISEVKKALVNGSFVALTKNTNDEAWHNTANAADYYICFEGCNWHSATKEVEKKTYTVEGGIYIWYNGDWKLVEREAPFFFDYNEQNVKRYYEYLNDEWVLATPYVEVEDAIETREFFLLSDALSVASGKTNAIVTILRDMPSVTTTASFTGASKTCTLDLNGHKVTGSATKVINVNASNCTFIIKDSQGGGELKSTSSTNALAATVYVTKGTVTLQSGTVSITSASTGTEDAKCQTAIYVAAGAKLNMSNGTVNATRTAASGSYCYGVFCETDGTGGGAVDITGGTISASFANGTYIFGVHVSGTSSIKNATISATGKGTLYAVSERTSAKLTLENVTATGAATQGTARGVIPRSTCTIKSGTYTATAGADNCDALYISNGTTTIEGGTFVSNGTGNVSALSVNNSGRTLIVKGGTFTATGTTSAYGIKIAAGNTVNVQGGTFTVNTTATGESTAIGIQSNGTTTVSAGTFNVTAANFKAWGIEVAAGTTTVTGGSFTATASTEQAHGTYIRNGAKLIVSGTSTIKGKLTNVKEGGWSTGSQVLGGGTLEVTGGSFIAESAKSGLSAKQKSYAVGVYANTNATDGGSHVSIANATIRGEIKSNYLTNGGSTEWNGGAHGLYSKTANDLTLTNCTIQAVSAYQGGLGIRLLNTPAEIHNCTITVNTTYAYNYGIFTDGTADAKVYNSSFTATSGTTYAYGAYVYGGALTAEDSEFNATTNQTASSSISASNLHGIRVNTGKKVTLTDCTVAATGNANYSQDGYGLYVDGSADVTNSTITVSNVKKNAYAVFNTSNTTLINLYSGKFKASAGTGTILACNGTAAAAKQVITGGYYSTNTNLSNYATAPYQVWFTTAADKEIVGSDYIYKVVEAYSVTFNANGHGTAPATQQIEKGQKATKPTAPTATGYTLGGWYKEAGCTNAWNFASNTVTEATTLYAKWTPVNYTITYNNLEGASNSNPANYTIESANITLADPGSRTGYDFGGWYTNEGLTTPAATPAIATGSTGNKTFWAKWTLKKYTITYNKGANGTGSVAAGEKTYGVTFTLSSNKFTRTGYTQTGWSTTDGGTKAYDLGGSYTDNAAIKLYPFWTINQYTLTVLSADENMGTVSGGGDYDYNTPVTITATPKAGFKFVKWNDDNTNASREVTVTADVTYTATFDYDIANYTVKHWQQNINNDVYTEVTGDQQDIPGTIGEQTAAVAKNYTGFTAQPFSQETIALNNTVVNIYYNRKTYLIKWDVKLNGEQEAYKEETLRYGAMPSYGADPTKEPSVSEVYTFSGWSPTPYEVNKAETYSGSFNASPRPYTITFVNDDGEQLQASDVDYGRTPSYSGTPVSSHTSDEYEYTFVGWTPEIKEVDGEAIYTATYSRSAEAITVNTHETVTNNTTASSTTVEEGGALTIGDGETPTSVNTNTTIVEDGGQLIVASGSSLGESDPDEESTIIVESGGQLDVAAEGSIQADVFIIQATTEETGDDDALEEIQVSGELSETGTQNLQTVYYDLTRKHGTEKFLARVWYAVAVPWAVEVPNYAIGGVFIKRGENFVPQRLGATFDLISYDGNCRAQNGAGANCWVYLEDEPEDVMVPGKLYMIYLTEETYTIRFKKADNRPIHTNTLTVSAYNETSNANDANWNGIANPATYNAYMNVSANGLVQKFVPGTQPRDGGSYLSLDLTDKQAVGQPFFVQVDPTAGTSVVVTRNNTPTLAPRRAQAEGDKDVRYAIGIAANGKLTDRLYIQTAEEKEDKYVIGKDMSKMGVSSYVAQMWIERFNSKLCLNTMMLTNNKASYPLGIYAPQAGDYMIFAPANMESGDNIYLTYDGRVIWNLTIAPYYASLEQGTITRYGLRLVRSNAPAVSTGVDEVQSENAQCTKVIMDDQVYILRGEKLYTITGQLVQ